MAGIAIEGRVVVGGSVATRKLEFYGHTPLPEVQVEAHLSRDAHMSYI
jgi:hypothetical protein